MIVIIQNNYHKTGHDNNLNDNNNSDNFLLKM